ncbi:MAG: HDOD domain-containing protein [Rhodocyclaceae bacterium]|nr:HDOD domain-containing protein [Rhodocyclaceae bacterium]
MQMLNTENILEDIPLLARALPPFPKIVLELLDLLRKDQFSLDCLVRLARNDPVISANILANANHIRRLRIQSDLSDPFAAASLIGMNCIKGIVASVGMNQFLAGPGGDPFFFRHSLAVAVVAHELALLTGVSPEEAYVAGMLHDIGQLCFHVVDHLALAETSRRAAVDGRLIEHETAAFQTDHCRLGAELAEHWNLPEEIVSAIRTHHDGATVTSRLQATVCVADTLARALDLPPSPNNRVTCLNGAAVEALGLHWNSPEMADCFGRCRARARQAMKLVQ